MKETIIQSSPEDRAIWSVDMPVLFSAWNLSAEGGPWATRLRHVRNWLKVEC